MNHRVQVRAAQDHVLRDSLAGSSLSALTLVVATMLAAHLIPKADAPVDREIPWPRDPIDIIRVFPTGGPPPPPAPPDVVTAFIPGLDETADTARVEPAPPLSRWEGDGGFDPDAPPGPGGGGSDGTGTPPGEPEVPPLGVWVPHDELPVVVRRIVPLYPDLARQAGLEANVTVQVFVGVDGRVQRAEVVTRPSVFDDAALSAVRQWVFTPAKANGHPVAVWMAVPVVFRLH